MHFIKYYVTVGNENYDSMHHVYVVTQARVFRLMYVYDILGHCMLLGQCIYIRQSMSACAITKIIICRTSDTLKVCVNLQLLVPDHQCMS